MAADEAQGGPLKPELADKTSFVSHNPSDPTLGKHNRVW